MIQSVIHKVSHWVSVFKSLKLNDSVSLLLWNSTLNSRNALKRMQMKMKSSSKGEGGHLHSQWTEYSWFSPEGLRDKKHHRLIRKAHNSCWCELRAPLLLKANSIWFSEVSDPSCLSTLPSLDRRRCCSVQRCRSSVCAWAWLLISWNKKKKTTATNYHYHIDLLVDILSHDSFRLLQCQFKVLTGCCCFSHYDIIILILIRLNERRWVSLLE